MTNSTVFHIVLHIVLALALVTLCFAAYYTNKNLKIMAKRQRLMWRLFIDHKHDGETLCYKNSKNACNIRELFRLYLS